MVFLFQRCGQLNRDWSNVMHAVSREEFIDAQDNDSEVSFIPSDDETALLGLQALLFSPCWIHAFRCLHIRLGETFPRHADLKFQLVEDSPAHALALSSSLPEEIDQPFSPLQSPYNSMGCRQNAINENCPSLQESQMPDNQLAEGKKDTEGHPGDEGDRSRADSVAEGNRGKGKGKGKGNGKGNGKAEGNGNGKGNGLGNGKGKGNGQGKENWKERVEQHITDKATDLIGAHNAMCLFKPLMKLCASMRVHYLMDDEDGALDPSDIFALSSFFGRSATNEHIRFAIKDPEFLKTAVKLLGVLAETHIKERTVAVIQKQAEDTVLELFGEDEHISGEMAIQHAEGKMREEWEEMKTLYS
jgi:hypothetical protein